MVDLWSSPGIGVVLLCAAPVALGAWILMSGPPSEESLLSDWSAVPPWPVFTIANALVAFLDRLRNAISPPPMRMLDMTFSFTKSQIVRVLAKADIAEHLATGPKTAAELATLTGLQEDKLYRVLRVAVAQGLLGGSTDRRGVSKFRNNALSATLRESHPNCVRSMALHLLDDTYDAWSKLWPALESDKVPWDLQHPDIGIWQYFEKNPEVEKIFSKAMTGVDNLGMAAAIADYRWGDFNRVVDVGGAFGSTLAAVLRSQPSASGVLFDLPQVIDRAKGVWDDKYADIKSRVQFVGGSFFDADALPVAKGPGDVYVMRVVLHDWPDNKTVDILKRVREAIGDSGAILAIIEAMPADKLTTFGIKEINALMDIHMYALQDGMERTKGQWEVLLKQSGFQLAKTYSTRSLFTVTEARAV